MQKMITNPILAALKKTPLCFHRRNAQGRKEGDCPLLPAWNRLHLVCA